MKRRTARCAASSRRIGLISDTHGLMREEALDFLRGCDHIIHAGDVGGIGILDRLGSLAPVTAVRGNNDPPAAAGSDAIPLRESELLDLGGVLIFVVHDIADLPPGLHNRGVRVVVSGHSHRPAIRESDGVLHVNPGSAGPRRFRLPIALGELDIVGKSTVAKIVTLGPNAKFA